VHSRCRELAQHGFPPTLIVHGTADRIRPHPSPVRLQAELLALGVPADLRLYAGQDHEFDYIPSYRAAVQHDIAFFLRRMVADRDAIAADAAANNIFAVRRREKTMKASIISPNTYTAPAAWGCPRPVPRAAFDAETGQRMLVSALEQDDATGVGVLDLSFGRASQEMTLAAIRRFGEQFLPK
jgi:hypothetical protein